MWYRAHAAGFGPWWYAHDGQGRFDLPHPGGTCYLASHSEAAVRERLGPTLVAAGQVAVDEAVRMVVSRLRIDDAHDVADTTNQLSTHYGVTRELSTVTPYTVTHAWAEALHAAGHSGVRYWPRFSVDGGMYALALFGTAGTVEGPADPMPLPGRDACREAGIAVVGLPRTLPTIEPPVS